VTGVQTCALPISARKTHSAKIIGLENSRHFWRGVVDGDGHLKNRDGLDTDIIILTGASYDLVVQFEGFIKCNIEGAEVTIKAKEEDSRYSKLYRVYVYSQTARMLAKLLYGDCHVALDRKLSQAQKMFRVWPRSRSYVALLDMEKKRCATQSDSLSNLAFSDTSATQSMTPVTSWPRTLRTGCLEILRPS
jgi:hypothetical protein